MLVLKRRIGEEIVINETTRIRVLKTSDGGCSIGIEAPKSDLIRRGELPADMERILQSTADAIGVSE